MKYYVDSAVAVIGTALTYAFGGFDTTVIILCCFIFADYLTGVARAIVERRLSSSIGFKGIAKKGCILVVVMLAVMLDRLIGTEGWMFRTLCAYFYIANEGISILENAAKLGVPIPQKLRDILAQLQDRNE